MKIELEDADVERIASAVVAKLGAVPHGAGAGAASGAAAPTKQEESPPKAPPPPPPPPPPPTPEGPTIEDVRTELNSYAAIEGRQKAVDVMKEVTGVAALAEVPKDKYQPLIDKLKGK